MISISDNEDALIARYEIKKATLAEGEWRLLSGQSPVGTLPICSLGDNFEFSVEWGKLIFSWWDEERSQVHRILGYEINEAEIILRAARDGGRASYFLTLREEVRWREIHAGVDSSLNEKRDSYANSLRRLIESMNNQARVLALTTGAHRSASVPGRYARIVISLGAETALAIGASGSEEQADIDSVIAAGITWLAAFNMKRKEAKRARRLWFFIPRERSQTILERLSFIDLSHFDARFECFEVDERGQKISPAAPATQYELLNANPRELHWPEKSSNSEILRDRMRSLAGERIEIRQRPGRRIESFMINGLEFAQSCADDPLAVNIRIPGPGAAKSPRGRVKLTESNIAELKDLVSEIIRYRSGDSPDRDHPFYRLRPEAWLESLLRRDLRSLDIALDDRFVYSQIPAWRADERSVIDLLTVNHERRIIVIEIKAAEDLQLPMQGLDYWIRIEQARINGELIRRGMFPGIELADAPPLLYLVAPRLRFHRAFKIVAGCLSPGIEAFQIGINANWREGVKVHTIERTR